MDCLFKIEFLIIHYDVTVHKSILVRKKKGLHMKQHQTKVSSLSRDIMIFDLMKTMGWSRKRAIAAIEELEQAHLVYFPEAGGLRLKVVGGY